ncbi:MAG: ASPIC/UnbV domain-containing protein [Planctomycetota bacterium]
MRKNSKDIKSGASLDVSIETADLDSGASFSGKEINHLFMNKEGKDFAVHTAISGADHKGDSRSMALFDYDHDGYQDFILMGANRPLTQIYRNKMGDMTPEGERQMPVMFRFQGGNQSAQPSDTWGSRDGLGAKVRLTAGAMNILREYRCGEGLGAQNSSTLSIGIGANSVAENVQVLWPNGSITEIGEVRQGQVVTVFENPSESKNGLGFEVEVLEPLRTNAYTRNQSKPAPKALAQSPLLKRLGADQTEAKYRLFTTWFTSCMACKRSAPVLASIKRNFPSSELEILGFNNNDGDSKKDMLRYAETYAPPFKMLLDRTDADIEEYKKLQDLLIGTIMHRGEEEKPSDLTPGYILADADGNILALNVGVPTYSELRKILDAWEKAH